jgi:hypothetical protein
MKPIVKVLFSAEKLFFNRIRCQVSGVSFDMALNDVAPDI